MTKCKLTASSVRAATTPKRETKVWDTELKGFYLSIQPTGRKAFYVYYRTLAHQQRRLKLGDWPAVKPERARQMAADALGAVRSGGDPARDRKRTRESPTVADLCDRFLAEHVRVRLKDRTAEEYERLIDKVIRPKLGTSKVDAVDRAAVIKLHHDMRLTPRQANHTLAVLSKMFGLAEAWGLRGQNTNPVEHVERYPEGKRERALSNVEIQRLWSVLDTVEAEDPRQIDAVLAIKLLLLTGRRKSEVLGLRWSDLDLEAGAMSLATTKTGAKRFLLSAGVVDLFRNAQARQQADVRAGEDKGQPTAKQVSTEFVVRGHIAGQPLVNIQKPWDRIRTRAGLGEVRIHDLRHTYASQGAARGLSLAEIGKLLGQTQLSTTQRYAHLFEDAERRAVNGLDEHFGSLVGTAGH